MTAFTAELSLSGEGSLAVGVPRTTYTHPISEQLSGIVVNQNAVPSAGDCVDITDDYIYQEFLLPKDFKRGDNVPPLTGLQVFVTVDEGYALTAALDYKLDYYEFGTGWLPLITGTGVGTAADSEGELGPEYGVWFDLYFEPEDVSQIWTNRFRFGIRGRAASGETIDQEVGYDGTSIQVGAESITVIPTISSTPLKEGGVYPFDHDGIPALVRVESGSGRVLYSKQQGVDCAWYTTPNPLAGSGNLRAFDKDGVTPLSDGGDYSLMFRVLAGVGDTGKDFLGNNYRSLVVRNSGRNVDALDSETKDRFWLSKPNPSQFAVENLYFDVRDNLDAVVIDRMLLDPLTPGIFANVYFSNDSAPGFDESSWDYHLWERIPKVFGCHRRTVHHFPAPVTAKYIKVEFTHLQARPYSPGGFQQPIQYKKHPKWVADYFLALYADQVDSSRGEPSSLTSSLVYDALDLAYKYYADDIRESPDGAVMVESSEGVSLLTRLLEQPLTEGVADNETLFQIRTVMQPFLNHPFAQGTFGHILREYAFPENDTNYSTERIRRLAASTSEVASLDHDQLVVEKAFPVTYFYLTCRHQYKVASTKFENDRGYFAGVREIMFTREHYDSRYDHNIYIESVGDNLTVERNDFETVDGSWVTYATS